MTKLRELERRLKEEPENLGLRVVAAGVMREAGRLDDAVELYRSVAIAYRDQGRSQQAIAVCRSILEIAPDDPRCHALLATLVAGHKSAIQPEPAPGLGRDVLEVGAPAERPRTPTMPGTVAPAEAQRARIGAAPAVPEGQRARTPTTQGLPPPAVPEVQLARPATTPPPGPRNAPSIPSLSVANPRPKSPSDAPLPADDDLSGVPVRISQYDETPLPAALPYHVADPTQRSLVRISASDLPLAEGAETRPGTEDGQFPEVSGIASAARRISATLIAAGREPDDDDPAADLDTRQRPRIELDPPGPGGEARASRDSDEEQTLPRDLPRGTRRSLPLRAPTHDDDAAPVHVPSERSTSAALAFTFFAPLPAERRGAVLARFSRRSVPAGTTVIRQGEQGHPLVLVASGRLEVRAERPAGDPVKLVELEPIDAGDHVGEAALLARAPAPAHVVAATEAELLLLSPRDFYDIAGTYPALWAQLKEIAERRTREHAARLGR